MPKQIIIAEHHQVAAVYWEDQIQELVVSTGNQQVSDIYLGLVETVIPGIDAAFVNIGDTERNGFIHVTDLGPLRLKKTAGAITELLAPQQKVLVQVMKEPTGSKGPRLTGKISLPGRYLVLIPHGRGVNLSRRIRSDEERNRLRALAILAKPAGMGLLVRTEAEGKGEDAILEDLESLQKQWELIQHQAVSTRPPALLNRDDDFIQRVLRDIYSSDVNRIVTDSPSGMKRVKQHLMGWGGGRAPVGVVIDYHRESQNILEYFRVNAAIREALKPRVDLPSGGYVIIEPTEALTVIDVNSGSFTRSATARETVLWTNSEAATEIARQLRLRNIGGVIIVDFIDMESRRDQQKLLEHFQRALKQDKARPQIAQLSELGLVELTRKRQGQNIYELFGSPCSHCGGLGYLAALPGEAEPVCLESPMLPVIRYASSSPSPNLSPSLLPRGGEKETSRPPLAKSAPLPEVGLDTGFEYGAGANTGVEVSYHPTYQEAGSNGGNRRRRRRRGPEPFAREEAPSKGVAPLPKSLPPVVESEGEERKERRERPARREEVARERVVVELTPKEQDVFALMGVSPLLKLDRDFKDPKSVIVSVRTASGERRELMEGGTVKEMGTPEMRGEMPAAIALPTQETPVMPAIEVLKEPVNPLEETTEFQPERMSSPSPLSVTDREPIVLPLDNVLEESGPEPLSAESEESLARRRRRRSSAQDE
ncbi:MAG: Rne/Rng family ribonuclease [Microcystaceae cyanobacterium]